MSNQLRNRKIKKQIMFNEDTRNIWDSFIKNYKKYFLSNDELWNNNLTELKNFIDLNGRRPHTRIKTEKVLGKWLCTQFKNRKTEKDIMLNEDIKKSWDSFIKNYEQYFISNNKLWANNLNELKTITNILFQMKNSEPII